MEFNFIGDIAGNFNTLQRLLTRMPQRAIPFSLGDMVDRGPKSKKVIEFFKENGRAILGNHEHMMIDHLTNGEFYNDGVWLCNGGVNTLMSYGVKILVNGYPHHGGNINYWGCELEIIKGADIPVSDIQFLKDLPMTYETDDLMVTHAPLNPSISLELAKEIGLSPLSATLNNSVLWNRGSTRRLENKFQIHGHEANRSFRWLKDKQGIYGVNLGSSFGTHLTGMHWPSREIFTEEIMESFECEK